MTQKIHFSVLGQMSAVRADQDIRLGSPQQQAMLAALLLRSGRAASIVELIDAVWSDEPPPSAAATIRTYAWRLRQAFSTPRTRTQQLISVGDGYQLVIAPEDVDAMWAEQLTVLAARHRAAGHLAQAGERIGQALALWQGEPLAGVPGPHAEQQRYRLEELRLTLLESQFDVMIRQGAYGLAIPELGALSNAHPLREPFHALHIRALRAAGRPADALSAYHRLRRHLADELGVEPSRELRNLYQQLLADDAPADHPSPDDGRPSAYARRTPTVAGEPEPSSPEAAVPGRASAGRRSTTADGIAEWLASSASGEDDTPRLSPATVAPPTPPPDGENAIGSLPAPAQLPVSTVDFTGRTAALGELTAALLTEDDNAPRVAVITGMGGVGKTALAVRAAHGVRARFPDGQLFADMRGSQPDPANPSMVLGSFITALGVAVQFVPELMEHRAALLRSLLSDRRVLILLDNVHDSAQIVPLLPGSSSCAVLITSRSKLSDLPASARVDLSGFEADEAVALLERIAGPTRISEDLVAARELVHNCGLLPLAVRIVASRLASRPTWGAAYLTAKLADEQRRVTELRVGDLAVAAVFEMSYQQLSGTQAAVLRVLATVCDPEIGLPAAAAVLRLGEETVEEQLESLVDASLLDSPRPGRYRFHDLFRVFAQQQATGTERLRSVSRLLDFLLATAAGAFQRAVPGDAATATLGPSASVRTTFDDVRAARAWVMVEAEGAFSAVRAAARESRAAGHPPTADAGDGVPLLRTAVDLLVALTAFGPYVQREQLVQAAMAVAEAAEVCGDRRTMGRAHFLCGNFAVQGTQLVLAKHHLRIAEVHCRETTDAAILRQTLNDLGLVALFEHRYDEALGYLEEAISLARDLGQRAGKLVTTVNAALARLHGGHPEEAAKACGEALGELRAAADHQGTAYALSVLGLCMHKLGRYDEALIHYTECLSVCRALELNGREAQAQYRLADTLRAMGRSAEALATAERAVACCADGRAERDRGHALVALARTLCDLGRAEETVLHLKEAAVVFVRLGLPDVAYVQRLLEDLGGRQGGAPARECRDASAQLDG